jgi:hypothetical protein
MITPALTWVVAILVIATVVYVLQPVEAAGRLETSAASRLALWLSIDGWPPDGVWPPPREPFDTTPITPFETVGALPYEP